MIKNINPIDRNGFSGKRMNGLLESLEKQPARSSSAKVNYSNRLTRDVLVEMPATKSGISMKQALKGLEKAGMQIEDKFLDLNTVSGKISPETAYRLEKSGFNVYDNSPRPIMPEIPTTADAVNRATVRQPEKPWDLINVNPVTQTNTSKVRATYGLTGEGKTVAVIDSGFDHPEFELAAWQDFVDGSPTPVDPNGHGTHVSGDVHTIAPDAKIIGIRVMNAEGQGRTSDIMKGIQWAVDNKDEYGIDVINMSLGSAPSPFYISPLNDAVRKAHDAGIVVAVAAGNSGPSKYTVGAPGEEATALTVGAGLDQKTVSRFSSRGPTYHEKLEKPDITASGEYVVSWIPKDSTIGKTAQVATKIRKMNDEKLVKLITDNPQLIRNLRLPQDILSRPAEERESLVKNNLPHIYYLPRKQMAAGPGTSFASPLIAGVAALMLQKNPDLTPDEVKAVMMETARDMGKQYSHNDQGAGFVNAKKAIDKLEEAAKTEEMPAYVAA